MRITVEFAPDEPGAHRAEIALDVDGTTHLVELDGDGIGESLDKTSFYACTCNGGGAPGWPIVLALGFIVRRRRR
jgi:hypothetical protein